MRPPENGPMDPCYSNATWLRRCAVPTTAKVQPRSTSTTKVPAPSARIHAVQWSNDIEAARKGVSTPPSQG